MAKDFSSYLHVKMDDVPAVLPSIPGGHWFADISDWKTGERNYDKATGGPPTPVVEIIFKLTGPDEDVEGGDNFVGRTVSRDYRLNDPDRAGQTYIRQLAERTCGLDVAGLELEDVLDALKGQSVKVFNEPRAGQEEGQFFPNIKKVLPAS